MQLTLCCLIYRTMYSVFHTSTSHFPLPPSPLPSPPLPLSSPLSPPNLPSNTAVHTTLKDLLPATSYFRFNPQLSEDFLIDESRPDRLDKMIEDAESYVEGHRDELQWAATCLLAPKTPKQKAQEWANSQWNKLLTRTRHLTFR